MKTVLGTTDHQGTANSKHSITSPPLEQLYPSEKNKSSKYWKGCRKSGIFTHVSDFLQPLWKDVCHVLKKLEIKTSYDSLITQLNI